MKKSNHRVSCLKVYSLSVKQKKLNRFDQSLRSRSIVFDGLVMKLDQIEEHALERKFPGASQPASDVCFPFEPPIR